MMEAVGRFLFVESFLTLAYKSQKLQLKGQNERIEKFITTPYFNFLLNFL